MPFTGSTYTLPAGYAAANGVVSDADQHNAPLEDIEDALTSLKGSIDGIDGAVLYDAAQMLTDVQKTQARVNIGLVNSSGADLSGSLLTVGAIVATAVDTVTNELTIPINHGLCSGMPVYVTTAIGSLSADTIYWVIRSPTVHDKIRLASSYANAMATPVVPLSLSSGTLPSMRVHRDPTQKIVQIPSGLKKDGSQGGTIIGPLTGEITPRTFGADASLTTNALAVQSALHWVRTSYNTTLGVYTASGNGENVVYACEYPVQAGGIRQPGFVFPGLRIYSSAAGVPAFSTVGSQLLYMPELFVDGAEANAPTIGHLHGRSVTALTASTFSAPAPPASRCDFTNSYINGFYTKVPYYNQNGDLCKTDGSQYENRHRSDTARGYVIAAAPSAIVRNFGAAFTCYFWPVSDSALPPDDIGTITEGSAERIIVTRPFAYNLTPTAINVSATPIILTFGAGALSGAGIVNGEKIDLSNLNNPFTLEEGPFTLNNVGATTAELWTEDGSAAVSHLTAGVNGAAVTGSYVTGRVTNRQAAPVLAAGPGERKKLRGYILGYGRTSIDLDLVDGSLNGCDFDVHTESAKQRTFDIIPHPTDPRTLGDCNIRIGGDLAGKAHINKRTGGIVTIDGDIKISGPQAGMPTTVSNSLARLFNGDLANLKFFGDLRTTLTAMVDNTSSMLACEARLYDEEAGRTRILPGGTYTPTFTLVTNLDAVSVNQGFAFQTVGPWVFWDGQVNVDPTATGSCEFDMSLPIAATLTASSVVGQGNRRGVSTEVMTVIRASNLMRVSFTATGTTSFVAVLSGQYRRY